MTFFCGISAYHPGGCESHLEALDSVPCHVRNAGTHTTAVHEPDSVHCGSHVLFSCFDCFWLLVVRSLSVTALSHQPSSGNSLTTLATQTGCFPSWCNCHLTSVAYTLEFDGCCGNSCYLPLNVMLLHTGSLKKHKRQSMLYLPDSTPFAVTFDIPEIPESYGFAV